MIEGVCTIPNRMAQYKKNKCRGTDCAMQLLQECLSIPLKIGNVPIARSIVEQAMSQQQTFSTTLHKYVLYADDHKTPEDPYLF